MDFGVSFHARKKRSDNRRNAQTLVFQIAVLTCLVAMLGTTPLLAQSPSFPNFSSTTNLVLNGNASQFNQSALRLNPADYYQVGSAWFGTVQPVSEGFSTTFQFQISPPPPQQNPDLPPAPPFPADGLAFVIQSTGTGAIGQPGGYLGYGGTIGLDNNIPGIVNSVAIEFDTYSNGWDANIPNVDPANHVAVQSCAFAANTVDHSLCNLGIATAPVNLSDGLPHTVHIEYVTPPASCIECNIPSTLQVTIDNHPVFPSPLPVNLGSLITFAGPNQDSAYVGFTGATGAVTENNDILSWSFISHGQTITQPAPANTFTTYTFGTYLYKVKPDQNIDELSVTAVPTDPGTFAADRASKGDFPGAQCIVYDTTGGQCVEFHAACSSPSNSACTNVNYEVVTSYDVPPGPEITSPGFLKATGLDCLPGIAFDQNIITEFLQTRTDPTTKGSSRPTFSCFVAVQNVTYAKADLDIVNLAPLKVKPGSTLTYVATVTDFGPSSAQGVSISNTIPSGTSYKSVSLCSLSNGCSATPCTFDGTAASCTVGNLAKFGLEFMVVTVKVTALSGKIVDTATVKALNPDPDLKPDRSWTAVTVVSNR